MVRIFSCFSSLLPKTNMTMEKQQFEDVSPSTNAIFSIVMLVFGGAYGISPIKWIIDLVCLFSP